MKLDLVHRDVKPSNILLLKKSPKELEVKVSDLGLGKVLDVEDSQMSVSQDGSFYWTVPEMKTGKYVNETLLCYDI